VSELSDLIYTEIVGDPNLSSSPDEARLLAERVAAIVGRDYVPRRYNQSFRRLVVALGTLPNGSHVQIRVLAKAYNEADPSLSPDELPSVVIDNGDGSQMAWLWPPE
jgi:hypothetical protein